jgi:hypothetical protein
MSPPTDGIRASSSAPKGTSARHAHPRGSLSSSATLAAVQADAVSRMRCCARRRSRNVCLAGKKAPKMSVNVRSQPGCGYVPAYGVPVGAATRLGTADALARGSSAGVGGARPTSDACDQSVASSATQPEADRNARLRESKGGFGQSHLGTAQRSQCRNRRKRNAMPLESSGPSAKQSEAMRCRPFARSTQTTGPFGASVSTKSNLLGSSGPAAVAYIRRLAPPHGATTRSRSQRTARYRLSAAHGTAVQAMACSVEGGRSFQAVCAKAFRACRTHFPCLQHGALEGSLATAQH